MDSGVKIPFPGGAVSPDAGGGLVVPARVSDTQANVLGGLGGKDQYVIEQYNIPDHDHDLLGRRTDNTPSGSQFYVINDLSATQPTDVSPYTLIGGAGRLNERTKAGTVIGGAQKMSSTGLVRINIEDKRVPGNSDSLIGRPFNVMNPFITLNYIIRSGKPTND
jgi:microcystin-dependent protein